MLLCLWAGVVLVEILTEVASRSAAPLLHYWTDVLLELPLLLGILLTGGLLVGRSWPVLPPLLAVKIGCGLLAVGANLYCAGLVVLRYRRRGDLRAVTALSGRIRWTGLGIPFGVAAAWLGFAHFHVR